MQSLYLPETGGLNTSHMAVVIRVAEGHKQKSRRRRRNKNQVALVISDKDEDADLIIF